MSNSILMKLDQKWEKDQRSGLTCAKLKPGSHHGFLRFSVRHYYKNLEIIMACIFSLSLVESLRINCQAGCKESRVRQPGASGFCDRASEFCA